MNLLDRYSRFLKAGDAGAISALFAEEAEFRDDAPAKMGLEPISVRGRDRIEAFFSKTFERGGLDVATVGTCFYTRPSQGVSVDSD